MFLFKEFTQLVLAFFAIVLMSVAAHGGNASDPSQSKQTEAQATFLDVYKSPSCGCCQEWVTHLTENDFATKSHHGADLYAFKIKRGIQPQHHSCHTAVSKSGYVFEGHIPAKVIRQFLAEPPEGAIGLAVPAMPVGSPGMEYGDSFSPYTVLVLYTDGTHKPYRRINSRKEQY